MSSRKKHRSVWALLHDANRRCRRERERADRLEARANEVFARFITARAELEGLLLRNAVLAEQNSELRAAAIRRAGQ